MLFDFETTLSSMMKKSDFTLDDLMIPKDFQQYNTYKSISNKLDNDILQAVIELNESVSKRRDNLRTPTDNQKAKKEAKNKISKKFVVGNIYKLIDRKSNKYHQAKVFKCVKFIYAIKNTPVYIVIMKSLNNSNSYQKFALNQTDCAKYHIKYEPGLEVYSMDLNWKDITKTYNNGCK